MRDRFLCGVIACMAAGPAAPALADTTYLIQAGQDSSPYAFIPALKRGFYNSAYAFQIFDGGQDHSFEYYIQFDLPSALFEPGVQISSAYAWVYYGYDYTLFGDHSEDIGEILCHEVLETWSQSSMTWNSRPAIGPVFDAREDILDKGMYWCDVKTLLEGWLAHPDSNHGIALTSTKSRIIGFYTFDDTTVSPNFKPSLVVTANAVPEPAAASGLVAGAALLSLLQRRRARRRDR